MERLQALLVATFSVIGLLPCLSSSASIVPAFLWSSHEDGALHSSTKEVVNYQTMFSRELAHSVLSEGGWSNYLCSGEKPRQNIDIALIFLGRRLQSSDLPRKTFVDPSLTNVLELSFTTSNFSMAFPYVIKTDMEERIENSLITGFSEKCESGLQRKRIAVSEACSVDGDDFTKLTDMNAVQRYIKSTCDSSLEGQANVIVYCNSNINESENVQSEGEVLAKLLAFMEQLGARYSVLYASDPLEQVKYGTERIPYRILSDTSASTSNKSLVRDDVCQIKSSLLEGLIVAIVLLIILISGICCMTGIDTPSRFETPQDS